MFYLLNEPHSSKSGECLVGSRLGKTKEMDYQKEVGRKIGNRPFASKLGLTGKSFTVGGIVTKPKDGKV